jgi:hypothetical protein
MSLLSLVPTPVLAGAGLVAAAGIFAGGMTVASWRDSGALGAEKLAHKTDVDKLTADWAANLLAMREKADKEAADHEADRLANQIAKENADAAYQKKLAGLQALADRNAADSVRIAADAGRVRDELAAAIAAAGPASGSGSVPAPDLAARCSGAGGHAACGFLQRCTDLLVSGRELSVRLAGLVDRKQAALTETLDSWPK